MPGMIWVAHNALPRKWGKSIGFDKVSFEDLEIDETTPEADVWRALENWWPERFYPYQLNYFEFYETSRSYLAQPERREYLVHHWNLTEGQVSDILPASMVA